MSMCMCRIYLLILLSFHHQVDRVRLKNTQCLAIWWSYVIINCNYNFNNNCKSRNFALPGMALRVATLPNLPIIFFPMILLRRLILSLNRCNRFGIDCFWPGRCCILGHSRTHQQWICMSMAAVIALDSLKFWQTSSSFIWGLTRIFELSI